MKNVIALLLILVLSVQLLPIQAMGKCLANNTFTEEQCVKVFMEKSSDAVHLCKPPFRGEEINHGFIFAYSTALIAEPSFAIISPPPNFVV